MSLILKVLEKPSSHLFGEDFGRRRSRDNRAVKLHLTPMKTTVSSKGQIVLPAALREQDRIEPGQEFEIKRVERGQYLLKLRTRAANEGVVDWLLSCPEKDFFTAMSPESTDTL